MSRRPASLAVVAVALLAGCGGGDKDTPKPQTTTEPTILDTAKVARDIEATIAKQRSIKAKVVCPTGVIQQKGYKFACLATYKRGKGTFTVDQTDDEGHVKYVGQ